MSIISKKLVDELELPIIQQPGLITGVDRTFTTTRIGCIKK